ncbi:hypothetical protein WA556_001946, partial [Blastocystis sp. ATCC 50177/Nand II]
MSSAPEARQGDMRVKDEYGNEWIPGTQRADGSWRPAIRVKAGFVPKEEQKLYRPPTIAAREKLMEERACLNHGVSRIISAQTVSADKQEKARKRNEKRQEKKLQKLKEEAGLIEPAQPPEVVPEPVVEKVLTEEDVSRDLRRHQKKLRQIDELRAKASQGAELDTEQQEKLASRPRIVESVAKGITFILKDKLRCSQQELLEELTNDSYSEPVSVPD